MKKAVNNCIAQAMGLAAATVARYNELAQKGVDEDYGKEAYRLRPITQAPFYGYFMGGSLLCTCDGLRINDKCQVYDTNHKTIGGLYAIVNCSGSFICFFIIRFRVNRTGHLC